MRIVSCIVVAPFAYNGLEFQRQRSATGGTDRLCMCHGPRSCQDSRQMLFCFTLTGPITVMYFGAGIAQLVERRTEKPGLNTDEGSSPRCGKDFFSSHSQLPVQTLLRCPYSPSVQSRAPTFVRTLKI